MNATFEFLAHLLEPFTVLLLLTGAGLFRLCRQSAVSRRLRLLAAVPYLLLTTFSLPAVGWLALGSLEWQTPVGIGRPGASQAIVVLSGAVIGYDPVLDRAELNGPSLERTWHAARVYLGDPPCPVVVSGGRADPDDPDPPVAALMARELIRLGVAGRDVIVEDRSRDTYENAVESARLLRERGLSTIVLVTDAEHMPRAAALFRRQGLTVYPSTGRWRTGGRWLRPVDFVPSLTGWTHTQQAGREYASLAASWLRGRL